MKILIFMKLNFFFLTCHPMESSNDFITCICEFNLLQISIDIFFVLVSFRLWISQISRRGSVDTKVFDWYFRVECSSRLHIVMSSDYSLKNSINDRIICFLDESETSDIVQHQLMITTWSTMRIYIILNKNVNISREKDDFFYSLLRVGANITLSMVYKSPNLFWRSLVIYNGKR